jgi:DNA-binding transcriptional ArsR family regulator
MISTVVRKAADLSPEAVELIAERFRVLGEPLRIRLLQALIEKERTVGELVELVGSTQPNVSKHLRILQEAGIVGRRQDGNSVYCYIADPTVFDLCNSVCDSLEARFNQVARMATEVGRGLGRRR